MKSGKDKNEFAAKVSPKEFERGHAEKNCKGHFKVGFTVNGFYTSSALGPIKLPCIPQVMCHTCHAAYTVPEFEEWVERVLTVHFVLAQESLTKKQIKFLRQHFGFTQEEMSEKVGLAGGKAEFSKMESETAQRMMSSDTQVRMKLLFAKLLKIKDSEQLYKINEMNDSKTVVVDPSWFPNKEELQKKVKAS